MEQNSDEFADRVLIITGAAGGVGRTVTERWLMKGAHVLAVDQNEKALEQVRAAVTASARADSGHLAILATDVTTEEGASAMTREAQKVFGKPADTLVHLVGGFAMGATSAPNAPSDYRSMIALNLDSAFYCYRAMLLELRARGEGWIIGLSARSAINPLPQLAAYSASKAGLIALTESIAAEVLHENIHVNVLVASTIDTPANRAAMGDADVKSWVSAEDIADATEFLCSKRAKSISGASIELYARA